MDRENTKHPIQKEVFSMSNGPIRRKKIVTGTASGDSLQTHGEGRQEGPVGQADGYQERKDQQTRPEDRAAANTARPVSRPTSQAAPFSGSMNTQGPGMGSARPQQSRPSASSQSARPLGGMPVQPVRPQQANQQSRPQQSAQQAQQRPQAYEQLGQQHTAAGNNTTRASGKGGFSPLILIIIAAVVLLGGGGGLSGLFGGGGDSGTTGGQTTGGDTGSIVGSLLSGLTDTGTDTTVNTGVTTAGDDGASDGSGGAGSLLSGFDSSSLSSILGGSWFGDQTGYSTAPVSTAAYGGSGSAAVNRAVAEGSRNKYTVLKGNGKDTMTIMVYMCGADLESRSAMGTKDLNEMLAAKFGSNIRLIVYTGGSTKWQNNRVSSSVNQIWQIANGKLTCLEENMGTASMTAPGTLTSFIQYCAKNFKANRYALILWDHGSGSVSGYGYDEKNPRTGSMSLAGLDQAMQSGGVKFDFLGFDACLMATVENALMASKHADYLIASEETEPGIGWYYTNWLTALGENSSLPTLDIGQKIADDFVSKCGELCRGQQTTLSVVDLAEVEHTVPSKLKAFSQSITSMIQNKDYKAVSNARNGCREFAASSRIDQVDLTDLCNNMGTKESAALAETLKSAVKYNRYNNISNAYGLSVYFPYQKVSNVDKAASTYAAIGMDDSYAQAIRAFASVEASGQAVTGGTTSAIPSLFGGGASSSSDDMIGDLLSAFLGGGFGRIGGLTEENAGFLSDSALTQQDMQDYLTLNRLDASKLQFRQLGGYWVMDLEPSQWALVHGVDQNLFYDNGKGYVDLGLDNLFDIANGFLVADMDHTWLALNGQPVAYYHETSEANETAARHSGRVPALLNGQRVELLVVFEEQGEALTAYVAGARPVYEEGVDAVAKEMIAQGAGAADPLAADPDSDIMPVEDEWILKPGDVIQPLADLYDYDQNFIDSYAFGNPILVGEEPLLVSNVVLPDETKCLVTYRVTDIYNQAYWTPAVGR